MLLDCFAAHPPWVVMHEDGSEFYYSHCFDDCQFFWTMTYLCAKTQIVGVICLWRGVGGGGGAGPVREFQTLTLLASRGSCH